MGGILVILSWVRRRMSCMKSVAHDCQVRLTVVVSGLLCALEDLIPLTFVMCVRIAQIFALNNRM